MDRLLQDANEPQLVLILIRHFRPTRAPALLSARTPSDAKRLTVGSLRC